MPSSDPAFDALFEVWTPSNSAKHWRVRFTDGGIAVFSGVLAHEDELRLRRATGTVVRQLRASKGREWTVGQETWFDIPEIKDVTDVELGDVVFPPGAAPRRPLLQFTPSKTTKALLGAAGVAFLGVLSLVVSVAELIAHNGRKNWPTVPAVITSVSIERIDGSGRSSGSSTYIPTVTYWYAVNGTRRSGTVVAYEGASTTTLAELRQLITFEVGDTVQARFNPANPDEATLFVLDAMWAVGLLVLAPVMLFGAFLWWHSTIPQKSGLYD